MHRTQILLLATLIFSLSACSKQAAVVTDFSTQSSESASARSSSSSSAPEKAGVTPLDDTWNLYTNRTTGYSMKLPKTMYVGAGAEAVPVMVFEESDGTKVHIAPLSYTAGGTDSQPKPVTVDLFTDGNEANDPPSWAISSAKIGDLNELEGLVMQVFGADCHIGNTELLGYDTMKVAIQADSKVQDEHACQNLMKNPVLFFSPSKKAAVYWYKGPSAQPTFVQDRQGKGASDEEMQNSFRFE